MHAELEAEMFNDVDFFAFIVEVLEVALVVCVRVLNKVYLGIAAVDDTVINCVCLADKQILWVGHGTLFVANLQNGEDCGQNRGDSVIEIDWILPQPSLHVRVEDEDGTEYVPAEGEDKEHAADVLARLGSVALDYLGSQVDCEEEGPEDARKPAKRLCHNMSMILPFSLY